MLQIIRDTAEEVGIVAVVLNSEQKLTIQLDGLTRKEDDPIMLISWDITTNLAFDINGFLENPTSNITAILVSKPEDNTRDEHEDVAVAMGELFVTFVRALYTNLIPYQRNAEPPVTDVSYQLIPRYGSGKHSGILGRWTMKTGVTNCTNG